jgi:hypothetical protein
VRLKIGGGTDMKEAKVLMITRVNTIWKTLDEFNKYWGESSLSFWTENGAKHLGSYLNHTGARRSDIVRLFEFDSLSAWNKFMELRESMFKSEEGKQRLQNIIEFVHDIEESVWISIY